MVNLDPPPSGNSVAAVQQLTRLTITTAEGRRKPILNLTVSLARAVRADDRAERNGRTLTTIGLFNDGANRIFPDDRHVLDVAVDSRTVYARRHGWGKLTVPFIHSLLSLPLSLSLSAKVRCFSNRLPEGSPRKLAHTSAAASLSSAHVNPWRVAGFPLRKRISTGRWRIDIPDVTSGLLRVDLRLWQYSTWT